MDYQERMREVKKACKRLFDTQDGQTILKWLEKKYYYVSSFDRESPYITAYNNGRRDVVGAIKKYIDEELKEK